MRKLIITVFVVGMAAFAATAAPTRAEVLVNERVPISFSVFNWCALDGLGEAVHVDGEFHFLTSVTQNDNNVVAVRVEGFTASGVGLVTGDRYQVMLLFIPDPFKLNLVNGQLQVQTSTNMRIIGRGRSSNFIVQGVHHITVNPQGETTVEFSHGSAKCI